MSFGNDGFNVAATLPCQHWHVLTHYGGGPIVLHIVWPLSPCFLLFFSNLAHTTGLAQIAMKNWPITQI
jgi:hypothetical protein